MLHRACFAGISLLLPLASRAAAQRVELRLHELASATPVAGAIVRLVGNRGPVAQGLTSEQGRLTLRAPDAGTYRLRIDRIGWSGFTTDPIELGAGQTLRLDVPMASGRNSLPDLIAEGRSACGANARGGPLATALWDEIRKALTASVLTQRERMVPVHLREFVREVSLDRKPLREWVVVSKLIRGAPFKSLPPGMLASLGFVHDQADGAYFAAPDAALLLSEEFIGTHCFRAVAGSGTLAGLTFEPAPNRSVIEVSGTLWVDRATSELRHLDYSYTGFRGLLRRADLGGRVEFRRLPSGAWIVSYWHIRTPTIESRTVYLKEDSTIVTRHTGYKDLGGRAEIALDTLGMIDRAIVVGRVFDSTVGRGVAGAFVSVPGTADSIVSDSTGRFSFAVQASGDRIIAARHPKLGLLREPTSRTALLSLGDTTVVQFAVPPLAAFARALCSIQKESPAIVGLAARVDGRPAIDQPIVARQDAAGRRSELGVGYREKQSTLKVSSSAGLTLLRHARSDGNGLYALCGMPWSGTVYVRMENDDLTLLQHPVEMAKGQSQWVDLREWGTLDTTRVRIGGVVADSTDRTALPGRAALRGRVVDSTTGLGLSGAVVRVQGGADSALTDAEGGFLFGTDASGSRTVTVTHPQHPDLVGRTADVAALALGDTVSVSFQVIPVSAAGRRLCGEPRRRSGLLGIAFGSSGQPEENLALRAQWNDGTRFQEVRARSGAGGVYAFCDLEPGQNLAVRIVGARGGAGGGSVRLQRGEYRWQELRPAP